jgi:hypothetical protein
MEFLKSYRSKIAMNLKVISVLSIFCAMAYACGGADKYNPANDNPPIVGENEMLKKIKGNSIQIDPTMLASINISPDELIADLKKADIKSVHFFIVNYWDGSKNDNLLRPEYLNALKSNGIAVWLMLVGNCLYGTSSLPSEWEMGLLSSYPGVTFYSFHNNEYVNWQVNRVKTIMQNYDFDGIEFAESYFPEWKTVNTNGIYGDVSYFAREKFTREYLNLTSPALDFSDIRNTPNLYQKWQSFRADAIINFNTKIKEAIKTTNRNTLFAAWGIGIRNGSLAEIREHFGLDILQIARDVKPDVLFIQTASQDWSDASLEYNYLAKYAYIVNALHNTVPDVVLGIQTDIASLSWNNSNAPKRTFEWWINFCNLSLNSGYYTNTAYEYCFAKRQNLWI